MKRLNEFFKEEKGQALPLVALLIVVLFGFAALVVDVGVMASSQSKLQKTADAAALAAVMDLPNQTKAEVTANYYTSINGGTDAVVDDVEYPAAGQVRVTVSEPARYFFARLSNFDSATSAVPRIDATAVAIKSIYWDGYAMPFINLDQKYWDAKYWGPSAVTINLWNKQSDSSGSFELLHADELDTSKGYLKIVWTDGVKVREGNVANYENYINNILLTPPPYYVISLDQERITSRLIEVKTKQGNIITVDLNQQNQKLNEGDVILEHQLVLLEFKEAYIQGNGANMWVYGKLSNVYDINDDIFPTNSKFGLIKSRLVE